MSLSQLFDHNDAEQIASAVHQIRDTTTGSFDASELLQNLDKLNEPFQSKHWIFSSPATIFRLFALIILLSFLVWKKCSTKPLTNKDVPAPSAPPILPVLQPAVNWLWHHNKVLHLRQSISRNLHQNPLQSLILEEGEAHKQRLFLSLYFSFYSFITFHCIFMISMYFPRLCTFMLSQQRFLKYARPHASALAFVVY
jgi:hypothetical protein